MEKLRLSRCKIISNIALVKDRIFLMELESDCLAHNANPGQFVKIRCNQTSDPLLSRPFSIYDAENGRVKILYQVVGRGTKLLSQKKAGDVVDVLGPLGNGFSLKVGANNHSPLLFAGGIGVAPLYFLARRFVRATGRSPLLYFGARSSEYLPIVEPFKKLGVKVYIATEDGSCGEKGMVTCLLDNKFVGANNHSPLLYICGPWPMMKEIARFCQKNNLTGQASLEKEMACGIGACLGCVIKIRGEYERVCKDGPVFDINEADWDEN